LLKNDEKRSQAIQKELRNGFSLQRRLRRRTRALLSNERYQELFNNEKRSEALRREFLFLQLRPGPKRSDLPRMQEHLSQRSHSLREAFPVGSHVSMRFEKPQNHLRHEKRKRI
jgi:hypothetical protein